MHEGQQHVSEETAQRLIHEQFPQWKHLTVSSVTGAGTVNAIFRIGDDLSARFPLNGEDPAQVNGALQAEAAAMAELSAVCPFPTPQPVVLGAPGEDYPLPWSVQTWVPGDVATPSGLQSSSRFTLDLVALLRSLREAPTDGRTFAGRGRGGNLQDSDEWVARCLAKSEGLLPVEDLRELWGVFRELPPSGPDRMTHGDLIPANLLVERERLVGVLDGGGFGPTDPALDLVAAWHLLDGEAREVLRRELGVGDVEWFRGAAWAFQQAMGLGWYYRQSNPVMSDLGQSTLRRIMIDPEVGRP